MEPHHTCCLPVFVSIFTHKIWTATQLMFHLQMSCPEEMKNCQQFRKCLTAQSADGKKYWPNCLCRHSSGNFLLYKIISLLNHLLEGTQIPNLQLPVKTQQSQLEWLLSLCYQGCTCCGCIQVQICRKKILQYKKELHCQEIFPLTSPSKLQMYPALDDLQTQSTNGVFEQFCLDVE